ncbi:MAG: TonB-dependent receptor, partial [Turneriella sp.]|nr:TonB-dependent receptor [Turneriella sp.]
MKYIALFCAIVLFPVWAQAKKVVVAEFSPLERADEQLAQELQKQLVAAFGEAGFQVTPVAIANTQNQGIGQILDVATKEKADFAVAGFYRRNSAGDLVLYAQVYSVPKRALIDAQSFLPLSESVIQAGLESGEVRTTDGDAFKALSRRLVLALRSNPTQQERAEKLQEHVMAQPAIAGFPYPRVKTEERAAVGADVFRLIAEKEETISIVSKSVTGAESAAKSSAIVTVFSRRQIEASGARNLTDMLKLVPGVEIYYDQMGFYKVSFRGIRSKSGVLLLLDGHRINNFYDGSTFLDLRADVIEKIEIIRGPGSSVHGTNAFVGVINVITRDAGKNGENNWFIASRYGMFNTLEQSVFYGDKRGDFSYSAQGHFYSSDRQSFHIPYDATCPKTRFIANQCDRTQIPLPLRPDIRTNDRKDQINTFFDLRYRENWYLRTNYIHEDRGPNVGELSQVTPDSRLTMHIATLDIGVDNTAIGKVAISSRLYGDITRRADDIQVEREDVIQHAGLSPRKKNSYNAITFGNETIAQYPLLNNLSLQVGIQLENLRVSDYRVQQNYAGTNVDIIYATFADYDNLPKEQNRTRTIVGIFTQLNWTIFSWVALTAGVRYDYYSDFGSTINPKGGLVITAFDSKKWGELIIKLLYGQAFRAPTFQELYD